MVHFHVGPIRQLVRFQKHGRWCAAHVHIAWNTHVRKHHSHLVNGQRHTTGLLQRLTLPSHIQPHPFGFCDATDFARKIAFMPCVVQTTQNI